MQTCRSCRLWFRRCSCFSRSRRRSQSRGTRREISGAYLRTMQTALVRLQAEYTPHCNNRKGDKVVSKRTHSAAGHGQGRTGQVMQAHPSSSARFFFFLSFFSPVCCAAAGVAAASAPAFFFFLGTGSSVLIGVASASAAAAFLPFFFSPAHGTTTLKPVQTLQGQPTGIAQCPLAPKFLGTALQVSQCFHRLECF